MRYLLLLLTILTLSASLPLSGQTISGSLGLCDSHTTTLTGSPTGGTWTSSSTSVAMIGTTSGIVSGLTAGTAVISYTLPSSAIATAIVTVYPSPAAISGTLSFCNGATSLLSNSTTGGSWSSSNVAVAPVNPTTGVVTGTSAGYTTISYSLGSGCFSSAIVTVNALPASISGPSTICVGAAYTYSDATTGGIWTSSNTSIASVSSGSPATVTGVAAGTANISYFIGSGCSTSATVTVEAAPNAGSISGPSTVCLTMPVTLTASVSGGTWSSGGSSIATVSSTGVVTGFSTGAVIITYTVTGYCGIASTTWDITISNPPSSISGTSVICSGNATTLTNSLAGGTWSSSASTVATIGITTGIVSGIGAGTSIVTYALGSGCATYKTITVNATPTAISGVSPVCVGHVIALADALAGGTWVSSNPAVATIATLGATTGVVTGVSAGTAAITYGMSTGCNTSAVVTVNGIPVITASAVLSACGGTVIATAIGGSTYSWLPTTGVACPSCASTSINPTATTTYTVSSTGVAGCDNQAYITVNGNRIYGHINFGSVAPGAADLKVWLIRYNTVDSSLIATDSTTTCADSAAPFYQFSGAAAGSYMVKAQLLSSVAGTSGYIPTYGTGSANWNTAATAAHTNASDNMNINMIYGTVPTGTGFISGNIFSGAGKNTAGDIPAEGMLVFVKDAASGNILTYTYTNADGAYTFSSLAMGSYIIYPENFSYYTTPSQTITLSESAPGQTAVNFKEYTTSRIILPILLGVNNASVSASVFNIYPNPASTTITISWSEQLSGDARFSMSDMTGREVFKAQVELNKMTGGAHIKLPDLIDGIYFYTLKTETTNYSGKLQIQKN